MKTIVAFKENGQAYVLPSAVGDNGLVVISQPKYIQESEAKGLKLLDWTKIDEEFALEYLEKRFVGQILRQKLYVWWMGLDSVSKAAFFV